MLHALLLALGASAPAFPVAASPSALPALSAAAVLQDEGGEEGEEGEDPGAELLRLGDDAPPERIQQLAKRRDRAALDTLLEAYRERLRTLGARMEVLAALGAFDGLPELSSDALDVLYEAATEAREPELREVAIETLGGSRRDGRPYLRRIVESEEPVKVREQALQWLVSEPRPDEQGWYVKLYTRPVAGEKRDKDAPPPRVVPDSLRELAFGAAVSALDDQTLQRALGDVSRRIREMALVEWDARDGEDAGELARDVFEDRNEHPEVRIAAARICMRREGEDFVEDAMDEATHANAPARLSVGLAEIVRRSSPEKERGKLVRRYGKGKESEQLFTLLVLRDTEDPKIEKGLLKLLGERSRDVRIAAIEELARRGAVDAREDLFDLFEDTDDPYERATLIDALGALGGTEEGWEELLRTLYAESGHPAPRNAALSQLVADGVEEHLALVEGALVHDDRSTRCVAVAAVEDERTRQSVQLLVEALPQQKGRRIRRVYTDALWNLTGRPHGDSSERWARWWSDVGATFEPISERELRELERATRARELRSETATFFDVRIDSDAVIFVIDVSGSMEERVQTQLPGTDSGSSDPMRIEVARAELARAIESLDTLTDFNVIAFSSSTSAFRDSIDASAATDRAEALTFVEKLGAFGGTNLYGALRQAFEDLEVDTIFVLSDGEPSVGDVVDPWRIREHVQLWNEHRGITIHTIAIGPALDVLRWLAEDTDGKFTHVP